jgi:CheY-like chemotaxis protein
VKPIRQTQLIECLIGVTTAPTQRQTRFWVKRGGPKETPVKPESTRDAKAVHVLVAEDNSINQRVALGLLDKLGFRSEAVANGKEVLKALDLVAYDIILMDCQLPELDGYKTTIEIRQREAHRNNGRNKRSYIIAMTAHAARGAREKCVAAGMDDYLSKPVRLTDLGAAMQRALSYLQVSAVTRSGGDGEDALDPQAIATLRELRQPGKPDPVAELIEMFLRDTPVRLEEMKAAVAQYDPIRLSAMAHNLKGCASSIGASQMAVLCGELEARADAKSVQSAAHVFKRVEAEFTRVREALDLLKPI